MTETIPRRDFLRSIVVVPVAMCFTGLGKAATSSIDEATDAYMKELEVLFAPDWEPTGDEELDFLLDTVRGEGRENVRALVRELISFDFSDAAKRSKSVRIPGPAVDRAFYLTHRKEIEREVDRRMREIDRFFAPYWRLVCHPCDYAAVEEMRELGRPGMRKIFRNKAGLAFYRATMCQS